MIGFIGLSHLGIVSSIAAADQGFNVIGYDASPNLVANLNSGDFPIYEEGLKEIWSKPKGSIRFTDRLSDLQEARLVYFALDVPTNAQNESSLQAVESLIKEVVPQLSPEATLVILSQVSPGFTRRIKKELNLKPNRMFYQVETLVFGIAVDRATNPERLIVGCESPEQALPELFSKLLTSFNCPIMPMRLESAELAKISINCFLASSVVTSNVLAELCGKLGGDWQEIVPALKLDKRIGPYAYLQPGLGLAGGNIERDLVSVVKGGAENSTWTLPVQEWLKDSKYRCQYVLRSLHDSEVLSSPDAKIGFWGLAYKINTHSLKNAPSLELLEVLKQVDVQIYEPVAKLSENADPKHHHVSSAEAACDGADAIVVFTPYDIFSKMDAKLIALKMRTKVVIDPFRILNHKKWIEAGFKVFTLGVIYGN